MCQRKTDAEVNTRKDDSDEVTKLESKVVYALLRLQKGNRYSGKLGKQPGVDFKQVVDYLITNYCHLDGDIEAQVITALLSCVKNGIVCALDSGKYRLIGPSSKAIVSKCITRTTHGPKCCCLELLKCASKSIPNSCCIVKPVIFQSTTSEKKTPARRRTKPKPRPKNTKDENRKLQIRCIQKVEKMLCPPEKTEKPKQLDNATKNKKPEKKCKYCLQVHAAPSNNASKICKACHPPGTRFGVPYDRFSPREELQISP